MIDFVNWLAYTVLWGLPLLVLMFGTGLYFTIRSGFFQFRHFGWIWRHTAGSLFHKDVQDSADAHRAGKLSAFEAVCTAVGGTVGFGNIAGVATAVAAGGPGALMWMWICAFLGMILKQVEVTLGVYYRGRNENGEYFGGPTYYMQKGLGVQRRWGGAWKILGVIFGAGIFSTFFVTSSNLTAAQVLAGATGVSSVSIGGMNVDMIILMGFVITVLTYIATTGGTRGIAQKFSRLVPFMSVAYLLMGLVMIAVNITRVPSAFVQIFHDAFTGTAVIGGFAGATVASIVRTGVARSVYSNEAGWGTSPMVHASAETPHPVEQGLWGSFEVFFDTIVVCTIRRDRLGAAGRDHGDLHRHHIRRMVHLLHRHPQPHGAERQPLRRGADEGILRSARPARHPVDHLPGADQQSGLHLDRGGHHLGDPHLCERVRDPDPLGRVFPPAARLQGALHGHRHGAGKRTSLL